MCLQRFHMFLDHDFWAVFTGTTMTFNPKNFGKSVPVSIDQYMNMYNVQTRTFKNGLVYTFFDELHLPTPATRKYIVVIEYL